MGAYIYIPSGADGEKFHQMTGQTKREKIKRIPTIHPTIQQPRANNLNTLILKFNATTQQIADFP